MIKKLLIASSLSFSLISNSINTNFKKEITLTYPSQKGIYEVSNSKFNLRVNKEDLTFEISDGNNTYYSYYFDEHDTSLKTNTAKNFFKSAVSTTYIYQDNSTAKRDLLDTTKKKDTMIGFKELENGFIGDIALFDLGINFQIHVKLTDYGINVSVPFEYITEDINSDNEEIIGKLRSISIYPGLEMSYGKIENGYSFIPDGSGALIDYKTPKKAKRGYDEKVYGNDISLREYKSNKTTPSKLSLGMYALANNSKTTICNIVSGDEQARLFSTSSGINNDYNYSYFTYLYRETYLQQLSADGSKTISVSQKELNKIDISQDYIFSSYLSPSEMTLKYRSYLENKNLLPTKEEKTNLKLTYLMNENKETMFGKEVINMSTPSDVLNSYQELNLSNKSIINYLGYSKNGLTGSYTKLLPTHQKENEYIEANKKLKDLNCLISFEGNYNSVFKSTNINSKNLARNINEKYIEVANQNDNTLKPYYLLTLNASENYINDDADKFKSLESDMTLFNSIPNQIYSSFAGKEKFTLTEAKEKYKEIFNYYSLKKGMSKPNAYLLKYCSSYFDAPLSNNGYLIETSSFPFFSMLLSDLIPFYSEYINLNYLGKKQILRLIDYRIAPSYILTKEDSIKLFDTNSKNIFTSKFDSWKNNIIETMELYNLAFSNIKDSKFISHIEENEISINSYENGYSLIINYSDKDVNYNGIYIPGLSFKEVRL